MFLRAGMRLKYSSSTVNVVFDGNSLVEGFGASGPSATLPAQLGGVWPLSGSGITVTNLGIGGQTWRQMDGLDAGSSADVDAAWVSGRTNVLVCWETTNAVFNVGRSAVQAAGDCQQYISDRLSAHSWKIILMTTIPRQVNGDQSATTANNNILVACDDIFRANYRAWGAAALVDVRASGSPFVFTGYNNSDFQAANVDSLWHESIGSRVHLNDAGYAVVAKMVGRTLARLAA